MKTTQPFSLSIILIILLGLFTTGKFRAAAGEENPAAPVKAASESGPETTVPSSVSATNTPIVKPIQTVLGDHPQAPGTSVRDLFRNVSSNRLASTFWRRDDETNRSHTVLSTYDQDDSTSHPTVKQFSWFLEPGSTLNADRFRRDRYPAMFTGFPSSRSWTGQEGTWDPPGGRLFCWRW